MPNVARVMNNDSRFEYIDADGDEFSALIYSNGETVLTITPKGAHASDYSAVLLSNYAAHQLRDMLNARFPVR